MTYKAEPPSRRVDQVGQRPARFWKDVALSAVSDGYVVALDGRPVKTPKGEVLLLPNPALAALVAREWELVEGYVDFSAMPLTRLGFAAVDHFTQAEAAVAEAVRYVQTDLVACPSDYPQALIEREKAVWQPVIDWAGRELGLEIVQTVSIVHVPQPQATVERIQSLIGEASAWERAGLMAATGLLGSVVLALALWKGRLSGEAAFSASRVGEVFQSETWGEDAEAEQRASGLRTEAVGLERWFRALS